MWPLLKKQLRQTKAMQKMQPELARIKKETKGNKQLESMRMMELYKKHDINPFSSIGVLFIQLPIFIALFQVITKLSGKSAIVSKFVSDYTYGFLKGLEPIKQLISHPQNLNTNFFGLIDLKVSLGTLITQPSFWTKVGFWSILIVVLASAYTQYIMSKQITPKPKNKKRLRDIMGEAADGKQADQSELNAVMMGSMTKFLPIMMMLIMTNLQGAVVLYYTISNIVAVLQQRSILKEDVEEMIEIADEAPIVTHKKATAKAREKDAQQATIIRIKAKDTAPWKSNKREK
jgi:YidC/Oxa1 family membrane protein insertase